LPAAELAAIVLRDWGKFVVFRRSVWGNGRFTLRRGKSSEVQIDNEYVHYDTRYRVMITT